VVTTVLAVATAIAPTASQAGSGLCPANRVCIYDHADWVSLLGYRKAGGGTTNLSSASNDKMSSWENKTGTHGAWFTDANGGGWCRTLHRNEELNYVSRDLNDAMSSWRTSSACLAGPFAVSQ
jgi:hypothetical protein